MFCLLIPGESKQSRGLGLRLQTTWKLYSDKFQFHSSRRSDRFCLQLQWRGGLQVHETSPRDGWWQEVYPQVQQQEFMEARCAKNLAPDHWTNCMRRKQQTTCTGTEWEEMARDLSNSSLDWSSDSFWHLMKDPLPIIEVMLCWNPYLIVVCWGCWYCVYRDYCTAFQHEPVSIFWKFSCFSQKPMKSR
jgi:hypothetical protein